MLGWLIAQVFKGVPLDELILPFVGVGAVMIVRGWLEYLRTMVAHNTAAKVQLHLRSVIFDKVTELGPAHFGLERTGDAILAMIDGVEQLEIYFGQYLPQLIVSALTPVMIFGVVVFLDVPVALVMLAAALVTLIAPQIFHGWDKKNSLSRSRSYKAFAAEFLDSVQGLATLKAFGQSGPRAKTLKEKADNLFRSTMWVLATNSLARGITDTGIAVGAAATLALGAFLRERIEHRVVRLDPVDYNPRWRAAGNLNELLADMHAEAIRAITKSRDHVIIDKFAREELMEGRLRGMEISLLQRTKGEEELSVAAASIIAREAFLLGLDELSQEWGVELRKGAGAPADQAAREFVRSFGEDRLAEVAKVHFKNAIRVGGAR